MPQCGVKAQFIGELVVLIYHMCLDDAYLTAAVCQVDKALVAQLELAFHNAVVAEGDQICLAQCGVGLHAQLCCRHHGAQEALGRTLCQLGVNAQR